MYTGKDRFCFRDAKTRLKSSPVISRRHCCTLGSSKLAASTMAGASPLEKVLPNRHNLHNLPVIDIAITRAWLFVWAWSKVPHPFARARHCVGEMVLNKAFRVLRRWRPTRSVLLECRNIPEESLLFESGTLNVLSKTVRVVIKSCVSNSAMQTIHNQV